MRMRKGDPVKSENNYISTLQKKIKEKNELYMQASV